MKQLNYYRDSIAHEADSLRRTTFQLLKPQYKVFSYALKADTLYKLPAKPANTALINYFPLNDRDRIQRIAVDQVRIVKETISSKVSLDIDAADKIRRFIIEYHRKITLAVSCMVLFFIGAPLGAIIRKGGLGLPVVMSVIFFLFYHIISTIGEKYAKEGDITPFLGMWIAIIVLSPLGAFLTYKASADSVLFDAELYKQWFKKWFKKSQA